MDTEMAIQPEPKESGVISTILSSRSLYQHDPLLVLLKDRLHLHPLWIVSGFFVFIGGLYFTLSSLNGDFHPSTSFGDALYLLLVTIAFTFFVLIYLLLPTSLASVFNTLSNNGVISPSRQERSGSMSYTSFLQQVIAWVDGWWWSITNVIFSVASFLLYIFVANPQSLNLSPFRLAETFLTVFLPLIYIGNFNLVRIMLFFLFFNRLFFPFTIHVKPLHPDSSGGMGSLGRIGWMVVGIMVVGALLNFSAHGHFAPPITVTETVALTIVYLVLVVSLMIGWLALPHQVMVQARNAILEPLTNEYERVLMETMPSAEEETSKIADATERLWTW